ncbi:hypothetical protein KKH43_05165 [Patescibacteria group bacterium]|nr:hypothetical protein [Patescibacteria group bacterium]
MAHGDLDMLCRDAPQNVTANALVTAFANFPSPGAYHEEWDITGKHVTALADRIIAEQVMHVLSSDPTNAKAYSSATTIVLTHHKLKEFRALGSGWRRGVLVLNGNAGNDIAMSQSGGLVSVLGSVKYSPGGLMSGGKLEIVGGAGEEVAFGQTGGSIVIKGNTLGKVASKMKGGVLCIEGTVHIPDGKKLEDCIGVGKAGGELFIIAMDIHW